MKYALAALALITLAACATVSDDQCRAGKWGDIGFRDGIDGRGIAFVENHIAACADLGIGVDQDAWAEGRTRGLVYYCTPIKAYIEGRRGIVHKQLCPPALQRSLLPENRRGLAANQALLEDRRRRGITLTVTVNPGLFRLPSPVLDRAQGPNELDVYRNEISRLRTERLIF